MFTHSLVSCRQFVLIVHIFVALSVLGCDDNKPGTTNIPAWSSNDFFEPAPFECAGVKWSPVRTPDGTYRWIFYPEPVLSVIETAPRLPPGATLTIPVASSSWTLTRDDDTCKVQTPLSDDFSRVWTVGAQTDRDLFTGDFTGIILVCAVIILAVFLIMCKVCSIYVIEEQQKRKAYEVGRAKELGELETALEQKQKKLEKWEHVAAEQASKLDAWHKTEENNLQKLREGADEYIRRGMEMVRSAQEALKSRPSPKKISKYLREEHLQGAAFGEAIVVNFLADQKGFILFKWEVLLKQNDAPTVIVYRDDKPIRTDAAFMGKHGDHIIPGHRHVYRFTVCDAKNRQFGKPLCIEFKTPTNKYWVAESGTDEKEHEQKIREKFKSRWRGLELIQELKQSAVAKIKSKNYPEDIEGWLLSLLDALTAELGGEV